MTSAGEKQHYALALTKSLFSHLPGSFCIGLLYDIGCQLEQSCRKWGFLQPFLPHISFAISVFHAFGHHSIKALIPSLHVSGVCVQSTTCV
ncbi:hypothetical protein F5141DRAFT_1189718 [Pisolithus sp. B1]|nr:hypothetical protein F5141DRAFT_1189718 [Pisolithus sp. B1]